MAESDSSILFRAHRWRFTVGALFIFPVTIVIAWMGYEGVVAGDNEVRGAWFALPILGLYLWFDYMLAAKIISPPELEISPTGIRWSNAAMLQWNTNYAWDEIDGPTKSSGGYGVPLLQFSSRQADGSWRFHQVILAQPTMKWRP